MSPILVPDDPREQAQQMARELRQDVAVKLDAFLERVHVVVHAMCELEPRARDVVWRDLCLDFFQEWDPQVPLRKLEAALLRQHLREAVSLLAHPDESAVDREAFLQKVAPLI
jgi:hypothetical protein